MSTKPLERLTVSELLDLYGRTVQALAEYANTSPFDGAQYRQLRIDRAAIESEARRRDQATWMPAAKEVKREENGDVIFA